jgi:serine/threonine-protein kinase
MTSTPRRRPRAFAAGSIVGRYRIERLLGRGGMGSVYAAVHTDHDLPCALKVLHPQYAYSPQLVRRFFNEAKAVMQIRHPNVVEVHDFGTTDDGYCFLQMELLDGRSLHSELRARSGRR